MTSGGLIDTLTAYTQSRLNAWGREILGGGTWLGMPKVNILHAARYAPTRGTPTGISDECWMTELIVAEVQLEAEDSAVVLRACYTGRGRWSEERRRRAEKLLGRPLSRRKFFALHDDGFQRVRDFFEFMLKSEAA